MQSKVAPSDGQYSAGCSQVLPLAVESKPLLLLFFDFYSRCFGNILFLAGGRGGVGSSATVLNKGNVKHVPYI